MTTDLRQFKAIYEIFLSRALPPRPFSILPEQGGFDHLLKGFWTSQKDRRRPNR